MRIIDSIKNLIDEGKKIEWLSLSKTWNITLFLCLAILLLTVYVVGLDFSFVKFRELILSIIR